ncbi:unnamed protein product [Schistosoma margrebowiei]|nr:unnamed protein product [Schistosoma margrebowiei]
MIRTLNIFLIYIYYINHFILYTNESFITINDGLLRNFCQANEVCSKLNTINKQYFLMGLNYLQWINNQNYSNQIYWTSIVYLLPEIITTITNIQMILRDANPYSNITFIINKQLLLSPSAILQLSNKKLQSNLLTIKKNYSIICELSMKENQLLIWKFIFQPFNQLFNFNYLNKIPKFDSCYNQLRASNLNDCLYK